MIKNKNSVVLFLSAFLFILSFSFSFAYEPIPTHRDLTQKIVEIYNRYYSPKISQEQIQWMLDGSVKEDTPPRWINHFYDPIYKVGWTGEKEGDVSQDTVKKLSKIVLSTKEAVSSINWLHNTKLQDKYGFYKGNQTYEKALRAYAYATDLEKGLISESPYSDTIGDSYIALGHILHLLEDLGVPAHTRNDTHADVKGSNDFGDPYENWAAVPGNDDLSGLNNLNPQKEKFSCLTIDDCFINLAKYTNENFYSKDTIDDGKYNYLKSDEQKEIESGNLLFIRKDKFGDVYSFKIFNKKENLPTIDNSLIHKSYYQLLSKQIVLSGVEIIKNFYQDAQKEAENVQYPSRVVSFRECNIPIICKNPIVSPYGEFIRFKDLAVSFLNNTVGSAGNLFTKAGLTIADTLSSAKNLIKDVFNYDSGLKQVGQINLDNPEDQSQLSQKEAETGKIQSNKKSSDQNIQSLKKEITLLKNPDKPKNKQQTEKEKVQETPKIDSDKISADPKNQNLDNPQSKPQASKPFSFCSFGVSQAPSHNSVIINEVAWMGSTKSSADEWIELKNISNQEIDLAGWQIINKNSGIKINLSLINKTKIGAGKFILLERTDDNSVPNVTADLIYTGGLSNTNEGIKLFDDGCNLIDEAFAGPNWPAGDNESKKTMERGSTSLTTGNSFNWHTSSVLGGTPKQNNSQPTANNLQPSGGGGGGVNTNNNSQQTTNSSQQLTKILISEEKTNPTAERFIELYNPGNTEVSLTDWYLQRKTQAGNEFTSLVSKTYFEGKIIPANGYFLISRSASADSDIVIPDLILTESNTIQLKNSNQEVVDKVGWGSVSDFEGSGPAPSPASGQSNQRKLTTNDQQLTTFIDTDNNANDFEIQSCPSPKTQSLTCQQADQSPSAFFVYAPQNPEVGQEIIFNAASSTDPDGSIILYEWDFGDSVTSTLSTAITTHIYSQAGDYQVNLIVFDDQNTSSTATSTIVVSLPAVPVQSGVDHIVISEVMAGNGSGRSEEEFIELYNPTSADINLLDWSLKRKISQTSTSTPLNLVSEFSATSTIKSKSFFLIAHPDFLNDPSSTQPDFFYTNLSSSYRLSYNDDAVILYDNNGEIVDEVGYQDIPGGQSLERKAWQDNQCVSSQLDGEFLGNGCDTDNGSDFEIRAIPNPQNSLNLPEPRQKPETVKNFNVSYDSSTVELIFNWDASAASTSVASLIYKIADISSSTLFFQDIETTSTASRIPIYEVGRDYAFYIRAFDSDGLGSEIATSSVSVPSFIKNVSFYKKPDSFFLDQFIFVDNEKSFRKYLIDFSFNQYPFLPGPGYKVAVFYLNSEPTTTLDIASDRGFSFLNGDENQYLKIGYRNCVDYPGFYESLLLVDTPAECNISGGLPNLSLLYNPNDFYNLFEDNNIVLPAYNPKELAPSDYFTVAFYRAESLNKAKLIAIDKNKYYFKNDAPSHYAPSSPTNFSIENYDANSQKLTLAWDYPNDTDSIDINQIFHEISYSTSTNFSFWVPLYLVPTNIDISRTPYRTKAVISVAPQSNFVIRARDDFNNASPAKIISFNYSSSSLIVSDNHLPAFGKIILDQQLDSSGVAKTFSGILSQEFILGSNGYLTTIELKGRHSGYGAGFQAKIKKDQEIIDTSDNRYLVGTGEVLPDSLIFRFSKTPFLEASNTYQIVIEKLSWPDGGDGSIDFLGVPDAKLYYKINGLTP